jgi:DNA-binding transcriptional LysR family regulator
MPLFLDIVLHPAFCKDRDDFCYMPLFVAAMREHPEVRIVISSTWRHFYPLEELRKAFPADIAARVIGETPDHEGKLRHVEIVHYLKLYAREDAPWVALDDNHFSFPDHCANLVECDGKAGMSAEAIEKLRGLILQLKTPDMP